MFPDCAMIQSAPTDQMYDPSFDPLAPLHLSHPCVSYRGLSKTKAEKFSALQREGRKGQTDANISCQICPIPSSNLGLHDHKRTSNNFQYHNYTTFCPKKSRTFSHFKQCSMDILFYIVLPVYLCLSVCPIDLLKDLNMIRILMHVGGTNFCYPA